MARDAQVQKASQVLEEEIAALREQVALARRRRPKQPATNEATSGSTQANQVQSSPGNSPIAVASGEQGEVGLETGPNSLLIQADRLQQIQNWLHSDSALLPLIAKAVGVVEGRYLRRSFALNVVLSTVFLIAGWLLSTFATPVGLEHLFGR